MLHVDTADSTVSIKPIDTTLQSAPGIQFTKTVGLSPAGCAATDKINVVGPTNVIYCYAVKNSGDVTFTRSTLSEAELGPLLNNIYFRLGPGQSTYFTAPVYISQTTLTTATWDASDINDYSIDDTGPYNFIDISSFGTVITVGTNGSQNVTTPFNFDVQIYDLNNHHLRVSMNGVVRQSSYNGTVGPNNFPLPSDRIDRPAMVPFWDDLDNISGKIYHAMTGTAPFRQWIVQWDNVPHNDISGTITFQTIITEGVGPILFQYQDVEFGDIGYDGGASATIGVQKNDTTGVQYSFNTAAITNGMAVRFIPTFITATDSSTTTVIVTPPPAPNIELTKTAGLTPGVCAVSSTVQVPFGGGDVYYCYEVKNTGNITLAIHTLNDDQLGSIFQNLPYELGPGESVDTVSSGYTITQHITEDAVSMGLWSAYNAGPTNTVTATATATATVISTIDVYLPASHQADTTSAVPTPWLATLAVLIPVIGVAFHRRK
jgi:hypothetical protein